MHKDICVLTGDYDPSKHKFRSIRRMEHPDHLPVGVLMKGKKADLAALNHWLIWRGIPSYRVGLETLLERFEIDDEKELLEAECALSVSDNYWLRREKETHTYEELNFFDRSFDPDGFGKASFRKEPYNPPEEAKHTPNNTLCGYHRKTWIRKGNRLLLYKGSTGYHQQECINEWFVSQIAERLGIFHVPYDTEIYENQLVSVCVNFLDKHTDLVTAGSAIASLGSGTEETFENLIAACQAHGMQDFRHDMDGMLVLDYLVMNSDRHSQNHGILTDADTGEWIQTAPVFDTGTALGCFVKTSELADLENHRTCKFLAQRHIFHDVLLDYVDNLAAFDLSALDGTEQLLISKMVHYRDMTGISDERITEIASLYLRRVQRLKAIQAGMMRMI